MILQVYESDDAWMQAALEGLSASLGGEKAIHICLSGGNTPKPIYERFVRSERFRNAAASNRVHLWVGDEREAPVGSRLRNSEMIATCFEGSGSILHLWPSGPREVAAHDYEAEFLAHAGEKWTPEKPFFDLVLVGMGEDGHAAGLFSTKDIEGDAQRPVLLTDAPGEPVRRMTLAPSALRSSKKIIILIRGVSKSRVLMANLFGERKDPVSTFFDDRCEVIARI